MTMIAASSVAVARDGRFLLVKRGRGMARGQYAFPGGRQEPGESAEDTARRELREETGLDAQGLELLRVIELGTGETIYSLSVFTARAVEGRLLAGDDAVEAGWYDLDSMARIDVTASTLSVAREIAGMHCGAGGDALIVGDQ